MDDLDELLSPASRRPIDPACREELGERTASLIRRRRTLVVVRRVLAFAACYAAGIVTFWFVQSRGDNPQVQVVAQPRNDESPPKPPADPFRNDPPDRLEQWAAMATGDRRVELYRQAGDRFLERGSEAAALRCYRHSLDRSRPEDLVIRATEDTWLLMSLKMARQKEGTDVRN